MPWESAILPNFRSPQFWRSFKARADNCCLKSSEYCEGIHEKLPAPTKWEIKQNQKAQPWTELKHYQCPALRQRSPPQQETQPLVGQRESTACNHLKHLLTSALVFAIWKLSEFPLCMCFFLPAAALPPTACEAAAMLCLSRHVYWRQRALPFLCQKPKSSMLNNPSKPMSVASCCIWIIHWKAAVTVALGTHCKCA